jgi:hypothetical protein
MSVVVVPNALPTEVAEEARALFLATPFKHAPLTGTDQFKRFFPNGGLGIPDHNETYLTDFDTHDDLPRIKELIQTHIAPILRRETNRQITKGQHFNYKLGAGQHLRMHTDDYAGHTGFVWHLSKDWKWDWGGLLISVKDGKGTATLPVFNSLVIIDHAKAVPHCVTQVTPWAKEPRMMVTGIMR